MKYTEELLSLYAPLSIQGVLLLVWIASFVALPVVRWIWGPAGERAGTVAGVLASVALVTSLLVPTHGVLAIVVIAGIPALGWLSEYAGSRTGIPFGAYHYTDQLRPQLCGVPVLIPLAWLMMMPSSWAVGVVIAPGSRIVQWLVAAAAFTAWDLFVDPQMVTSGYWVWHRKGLYAGIPLGNFLGWYVVAFGITAVFGLGSVVIGFEFVASVNVAPLLAVYVATWLLQSVGHLVFWRLPVSGVTGLLGMGVFVALAAWSIYSV